MIVTPATSANGAAQPPSPTIPAAAAPMPQSAYTGASRRLPAFGAGMAIAPVRPSATYQMRSPAATGASHRRSRRRAGETAR